MNKSTMHLSGMAFAPLPSGALFCPQFNALSVSDLHLGKSERVARRSGQMLPPYETRDTLARIEADINATGARIVICLGDSFDDLTAAETLDDAERLWISRMQAGREWIWIEGNHDPGPVELGGAHLSEYHLGPVVFRHIAAPEGTFEVSGHFHPKAAVTTRGRKITRPCFLADGNRIIQPAYGTYTGGMPWTDPVFQRLFGPDTYAVLTGSPSFRFPAPFS